MQRRRNGLESGGKLLEVDRKVLGEEYLERIVVDQKVGTGAILGKSVADFERRPNSRIKVSKLTIKI